MSTATKQPAAPWLDEMVSRLGTTEVSGPKSNPEILQWFEQIGHPEIDDDATSWCAVTVGSCLKAHGYPTTARDVNMLARSYVNYGTKCEPKRGALAIWPRGKSKWQGHINIVEDVREVGGRRQVLCVGGNQSGPKGDAVTRSAWRDADEAITFRWPVKPTVKELRKAGSSEIKQADTLEVASVAVTTIATTAAAATQAQEAPAAIPVVDPAPVVPDGVLDQIGAFQTLAEALNGVGQVVAKNPWLAAAVAASLFGFWVARLWKSGRIKRHVLGLPISSEAEGGQHA